MMNEQEAKFYLAMENIIDFLARNPEEFVESAADAIDFDELLAYREARLIEHENPEWLTDEQRELIAKRGEL